MPDLSVFETWIDGMARLHNTKHVLRAVRELLSPDAARPLLAHVDARLGELP